MPGAKKILELGVLIFANQALNVELNFSRSFFSFSFFLGGGQGNFLDLSLIFQKRSLVVQETLTSVNLYTYVKCVYIRR